MFRALLTGQDDAGLIVAPAAKDEKAKIAGQEEAIERIRADLLTESRRTEGRKKTSSRWQQRSTRASPNNHSSYKTIVPTGQDRAKTAQAFKDILGLSITNTDGTLSGLSKQRSKIAGVLALYEQLHRLDAIEQVVPAPTAPKTKGENAFATLPPNANEQFATTVENILRAWSFPELDRVVFDTKAEDIVISGKARKDNGKGYRAITYAAFPLTTALDLALLTSNACSAFRNRTRQYSADSWHGPQGSNWRRRITGDPALMTSNSDVEPARHNKTKRE